MKTGLIHSLTDSFEAHAQQTEGGVEFWLGRDLQHLLGYSEWRNFTAVITKAKIACEVSQHAVSDHFVDVNKMVDLGSGGQREIEDIMLSRYACYLKDRNLGIISLQWWFGGGEKTQDYYSPFDIYREVDLLMRRMEIRPGDAMLEGFSRGSANIYAVAALDRNKGQRYFSLFVANSGRASLDYPPTRAVDTGKFGDMPYH